MELYFKFAIINHFMLTKFAANLDIKGISYFYSPCISTLYISMYFRISQ